MRTTENGSIVNKDQNFLKINKTCLPLNQIIGIVGTNLASRNFLGNSKSSLLYQICHGTIEKSLYKFLFAKKRGFIKLISNFSIAVSATVSTTVYVEYK